ncbi:MAG: ArsR/SmtB family transcription factor [Rhodospirillales bacterium]
MSEPDMLEGARDAAHFLKALANENRLLILCHLLQGERSVSELEAILDLRQPTLSQQLARLRGENLVATRRDGKSIYYSIADPNVGLTLDLMFQMFCAQKLAS